MQNILSHLVARRKTVARVALVGAVGLIGMMFLPGCRKEKREVTSVAEPPMVSLTHPSVRTIIRNVGQPSFVDAYERTSIYPKMTAYIEKWNVDIGDKVKGPVYDAKGRIVKEGEALATLYVPELREEWETKKATVKLDVQKVELAKKVVKVSEADVKAAAAKLDQTKATLDQYEADVVRWNVQVERLAREVKSGVVDRQVLLEAENQSRSSKSARDAQKAAIMKADADLLSKQAKEDQDIIAVAVAQEQLKVAMSEERRLAALVGYLVLPAPYDGIVHIRNVNTGDFVLPHTGDLTAMQRSPMQSTSGAAPVYVIDRMDIVRIFVDIPEQDANYVQKGSKASVQIRAFRDQWLPATVTRTAWALNVNSRTLRAEIDLPNTNSQILPGMYAYGKVIIERPNVQALPVSAIFTIGDKTYYWRYENGRAVKNEIQTGVSDGEWIEVTNRYVTPSAKGAQAWVPFDGTEQVIIADDMSLLSEGEPVRLSESKVADATHQAP